MRYLILAADYDGTLAQHGVVPESTVASLEKLRATGRKLILVTGRELDELLGIFPAIHLFDRVVAENGALLYDPGTRAVQILSGGPPSEFADALRRKGVHPMSVGRVIVATWKPHETAVLEAIRDFGLDLQVIFNKDAVMVLPASVNKASGLAAALKELEMSPHEVVAVGDAENDHAFLAMSECAVAVQNALLSVKERADFVTPADHGHGVEQLIGQLLADDLAVVNERRGRHALRLGQNSKGEDVWLPSHQGNLLLAGPSASGKSTICKSFLERLQEQHYQFCIIDPEGDYDGLDGTVTIGTSDRAPTFEEALPHLKSPEVNLVVNLVGLPLADRPPFFLGLLPRLQEMRGRTGRPHWIIVDEAHHLLPAAWEPGRASLPGQLNRMVFITVHPGQVVSPVLHAITTVLAVGPEPQQTIAAFCDAVSVETPAPSEAWSDAAPPPAPDAAPVKLSAPLVLWPKSAGSPPFAVRLALPVKEHHRHVRKYAEGEMPAERSFYFKGPAGKLNLRVQNLLIFNQVGAGVDDATWLYHLRRGDYSRWFREQVHDDALAAEAAQVEQTPKLSAAESRTRIKDLIERKYTLPVSAPLPLPGTDSPLKRS